MAGLNIQTIGVTFALLMTAAVPATGAVWNIEVNATDFLKNCADCFPDGHPPIQDKVLLRATLSFDPDRDAMPSDVGLLFLSHNMPYSINFPYRQERFAYHYSTDTLVISNNVVWQGDGYAVPLTDETWFVSVEGFARGTPVGQNFEQATPKFVNRDPLDNHYFEDYVDSWAQRIDVRINAVPEG